MKKILTLCVIYTDSQVLLGMKKRGFGEGRWNGFGGKVAQGESIEEATVREIEEEAGIQVATKDLEKHGVIEFRFEREPNEVLEVHIFSTSVYHGEPKESEEMKPAWFSKDAVPYDAMWPDDIFWLPALLGGKHFTGGFLFGENDTVLENTFTLVDEKVL